ncbi:MAG: helix-turn-helix transcriptional regulator [Cyanobacteria bacterium P01_A01_bin.40]
MILNERQYGITKTKVREFEQVIAKLNNKPEPTSINEQIRRQAHLDTLHSQLEEFYAEIKEYKELKKGEIKSLKLNSFEQLPEALIKARIIRGYTQAQLAEILQVKQQQVQRDENNKYASASFTKLLGIQKALNLEVKEELIFKEPQSQENSLEQLRERWGTNSQKTSRQSPNRS